MKTRNHTLLLGVFALLWLPLCAACAHVPAAAPTAGRTALPETHRVSAWTGVVRIAVGNSELFEGNEADFIESTVTGLIGALGSDVKVSCLDHEGDVSGSSVLHAHVRLEFAERMTLEQKFTTLSMLQSLNPTGEAYRLEAPLTGVVRGPAVIAAHSQRR
jgi:hypothetical protein